MGNDFILILDLLIVSTRSLKNGMSYCSDIRLVNCKLTHSRTDYCQFLRLSKTFLSAMSLPCTSKDLNFVFIPKKSSQKISPQKFLLKNSTRNPKKFPKISQIFFMILKISNFLHRTWRLETLSGLFMLKLLHFLLYDLNN